MTADCSDNDQPSADDALARLMEGNQRFISGHTEVPTLEKELLLEQAKGQQPYATILGCSDSRVPPELIFDAWLGELFVIRVAGNVLGQSILGTLQYAARYLHTPLFVVMGHEGCGAVEAAVNYQFEGSRHPNKIEFLLDNIAPAFGDLDETAPRAELLKAAVEANVRRTVQALRDSPEGQSQMEHGVKLIGAIYALHTGRVRFLE